MSEKDIGFFMSFALGTHYKLFMANRFMPQSHHKLNHRQVFMRLLARPGSVLMLACDPVETDVLYGFALGDPEADILHYAFVKKTLRKFGLFGQLVSALGLDLTHASFSHWTRDMALVMRKRAGPWFYDPYLQFPMDGET